jgi:hypothetical protein
LYLTDFNGKKSTEKEKGLKKKKKKKITRKKSTFLAENFSPF